MPELVFSQVPVSTPNPGGQQHFAEDWGHFLVSAEGGWGSGKTWCGGKKLVTLHEHNAFDRFDQPTYAPSLVVAPTYGNAMDFDVPILYDTLNEIGLSYQWHGFGPIQKGRYAGPAIILPDLGTRDKPSLILIRTADIPKRITGFQTPACWCDETARFKTDRLDPQNDAITQIYGRVRWPNATALGIIVMIMHTYTNEGDGTRIYEEMRTGAGDRAVYRIPTSENPLMKDFLRRQAKILTPELQRQYLDGYAAALSGGKVYPKFDYQLHVDANVKLRRDVPLQLSLDFNIIPGMHGTVGQFHKDFDMFTVSHIIHAPRLSVEELVVAFVRLTKEINWEWKQPLEVFGDATGGSHWSGTGQSNYDILEEGLKKQKIPYRIRVPKANPLIQDSINTLNCALKDGEGKIHYKIHPRCTILSKDFRQLNTDKFGEIDKTDRKLSHPTDCERYRIWMQRPIRIVRTVGGRVSVTGEET